MPDPEHPSAPLDSLRIRQTTALRRSLYRGRAYAVVAALGCVAAGAQCAYLAMRHVRSVGWTPRAIVLMGLMLLALVGVILLVRRALSLSREAQRSVLPEPAAPPDFSTLSDGSQRARNLEEVE